ncbi:simple sugar transport system permease protein [Clostridium tetanomorphum]|uniref:ABC transporter permease n=1 Tax=Clostridium tetanomorphum TaxID=1553 RepID=A0A923EBL6_CLOTT|nr:ABC transporter permease [Clostridium tetanomorphum]KAJ50399.1 sugar ABC transporter permease [Clostridium tetanomorphum DSM 665]MBC2398706.1 ABC transporter permease [Clostridium tetanomorphum]MBP1865787.1 simple sugar transport system permease protein [Clostridium tetanomorphum]NRS86908.1 simple sugar transport system permease protein [Clostridium tetanomorphum]NRZ99334.1 simple sugar transport system permease protein [Clostridium tetanomorphum]
MNEEKGNYIRKLALLRNFSVSLISIIIALIISVFFVMWAKDYGFGASAKLLFSSIWKGSFGTKVNFIETLVFATPLIFTGLAHAVAFKTGLFNIGVEGQFIMGMTISTLVALIPGMSAPIHIVITLLAGILGGAFWGAIPGYLKAKIGTNEVVNTIMMNFVAMHLTNYFVMGPFHKPGSASTPLIKESATLYRFLGPNNRLSVGIFIGIILAFLVYILLWKTTIGYEIRAVGLSPSSAEYGGISIKKNIILAMVISGAIAGIGGAVHIMGVQHQSIQLFGFTNFGMDGIAVALVAKSNPIGVIFSAILFAALNYSSGTLMLYGIPKTIVYLIQGIIILFIAGEYLFKLIADKRKKGALINE